MENPRDLRYGSLPGFPLSSLGRTQAAAAGAWLGANGGSIRALISSPLTRAVETAGALGVRLGLAVELDPRLLEARSTFDGLPRRAPADPRRWWAFRDPLTPSWGEPFREVAGRLREVVLEVEARYRGSGAVLVSHQSPIWLARLSFERGLGVLGRPGGRLPPWVWGRVRCSHASVTTLLFRGGRFVTSLHSTPAVDG